MFLALAQLTNKAFTDAGKGRIRQSLTALVVPAVEHASTLSLPHQLKKQNKKQTKKNISQKDLWNFMFDKSLKVVMGPPFSVVDNTWADLKRSDQSLWKKHGKAKGPMKKQQSVLRH